MSPTTLSRRLLALGAALVVAGSVAVTAPVLVGAAEPDEVEGTGTGAADQTVVVTPVDDLDPAGETVTVTGAGFDVTAGFDTATDGLFVALCVTAEEDGAPGPCVGGLDLADGSDSARWITNTPDGDAPSVAIGADGSFTTTITVRAADEHLDCADLADGRRCAVVVRADDRAGDDRSQDVTVPVTFGASGSAATVPPTTTTEPTADQDVRADATPTTTELIVAPTTIAVGAPVTATATVETDGTTGARSARAAVTTGTVELFDGTTSLGSATLGLDGRATRTATFTTPGTHSLTARFTGTGDAATSTSDPVVVTVTATQDPGPDPDPDPTDETPGGTRTGTGVEGQTLTVTPVDNLDPAGTEVEITGAGFTEAAGFDIDEGGLYVSFCVDNGAGAQPSPCVGGVDMEGASGSSKWVTNDPYPGVPPEAVSPIAADGSFTARITVSARDEFVDCLALTGGKRCVVVSRVDHRATADRSQDVKVPVCFAGEAACATDPIDPTPTNTPSDTPFGGYPLPQSGTGGPGYTPYTAPGGLAATGFAGRTLVPLGVVLLGAGAALVLVARRRAVPTP